MCLFLLIFWLLTSCLVLSMQCPANNMANFPKKFILLPSFSSHHTIKDDLSNTWCHRKLYQWLEASLFPRRIFFLFTQQIFRDPLLQAHSEQRWIWYSSLLQLKINRDRERCVRLEVSVFQHKPTLVCVRRGGIQISSHLHENRCSKIASHRLVSCA